MRENTEQRSGWSWWYVLFAVQWLAVLWPPFFNRTDPALAGIPFFYWYQLLWVIVGALLTAVVYAATRDHASTGRFQSTRPPREADR